MDPETDEEHVPKKRKIYPEDTESVAPFHSTKQNDPIQLFEAHLNSTRTCWGLAFDQWKAFEKILGQKVLSDRDLTQKSISDLCFALGSFHLPDNSKQEISNYNTAQMDTFVSEIQNYYRTDPNPQNQMALGLAILDGKAKILSIHHHVIPNKNKLNPDLFSPQLFGSWWQSSFLFELLFKKNKFWKEKIKSEKEKSALDQKEDKMDQEEPHFDHSNLSFTKQEKDKKCETDICIEENDKNELTDEKDGKEEESEDWTIFEFCITLNSNGIVNQIMYSDFIDYHIIPNKNQLDHLFCLLNEGKFQTQKKNSLNAFKTQSSIVVAPLFWIIDILRKDNHITEIIKRKRIKKLLLQIDIYLKEIQKYNSSAHTFGLRSFLINDETQKHDAW